jgi:hypothetical protein
MTRTSSNTVIRLHIRQGLDGEVNEHQTRTLSGPDGEDTMSTHMNTSPSDNPASFGENGGWLIGPCPKDVAHLNVPRL